MNPRFTTKVVHNGENTPLLKLGDGYEIIVNRDSPKYDVFLNGGEQADKMVMDFAFGLGWKLKDPEVVNNE